MALTNIILAFCFIFCLNGLTGPFYGVDATGSFVVFSVGLTQHQNGAGRIHYQKAFLNVGEGFKWKESIFQAPVGGIYSFSFHAMNHVSGSLKTTLYLSLYKNDEYICSAYADKENYSSAGNNVLLQLAKDDQVDIRAHTGESGLFGKSDQIYATFSGYLVVPVYEVTTYFGP